MKKIMKDAFALFAITLVSGILLAAVYAITKEPIAKAEMEARAVAYRAVFADVDQFVSDDEVDAALAIAEDARATFGEALFATDANGEKQGCVMTLGANGYAGEIKLTLGITMDGKLTGISILSHSETVGLGAKCTDEAFYGQFANKPVANFQVVKGGADADNEIDAISGATVTSEGVTEAVNAGIWFAQTYMGVGGGAAA